MVETIDIQEFKDPEKKVELTSETKAEIEQYIKEFSYMNYVMNNDVEDKELKALEMENKDRVTLFAIWRKDKRTPDDWNKPKSSGSYTQSSAPSPFGKPSTNQKQAPTWTPGFPDIDTYLLGLGFMHGEYENTYSKKANEETRINIARKKDNTKWNMNSYNIVTKQRKWFDDSNWPQEYRTIYSKINEKEIDMEIAPGFEQGEGGF